MFTHWVHAAYSSKECSQCHYIYNANRSNQEEFECKYCGHKENADINSAKNSKERYLNKEIRDRLGNDNVYHCHRSNKIYYKQVKLILDDYYDNSKKQLLDKGLDKPKLYGINTAKII